MLTNARQSPHFLLSLLVITLLMHLLPAIMSPLSVDEAHYALYGQHLALSYFDHPPLVGWLQAIALQLGDHEWQLRLFALLSYAVTLVLVYRFTLYHYHNLATANLAALIFTSIPLMHLLGIGLVPDSLLLPLTIALFWQAQITLSTPSWRNWMLLGVLIGLGALSKYTSILFALGLVAMLIISKAWHWFISPKLWVAVLIAGVFALPILIWNAEHDWISIAYQLNHGQPNNPWQWQRVLQSQTAQILVYTPLLWLMAWGFSLSLKRIKTDNNHRQLVAFMLPALLMFTLSSGKEPSLPHWLAFFYLLWIPSFANYLQAMNDKPWIAKAAIINIGYGFLLTLFVTALMVAPNLGKAITPNPTADLIGWKEAALTAQALRQNNEPLLTTHWVDSSRIAWYARPAPVIVLDDRFDQFDIWFGSPTQGLSGLLILPPDRNNDALQDFERCQMISETSENFRLYRCLDFIGTQ